jgi:apolipoprotein N-acyltransferase
MSLLAALSGLLTALSFPPAEQEWLAWFALAPLLFALRRVHGGAAAGFGVVFALAFCAVAFAWTPQVAGASPPSLGIGLVVFSLYFFAFGWSYCLAEDFLGAWMSLGGPVLWVALEYLRSNFFFLSWPWNLLGHSQYRFLPVIQIADVTGVYGISFLLVLVNEAVSRLPDLLQKSRIAEAASGRGSPPVPWAVRFALPLAALALTFGYGRVRLGEQPSGERLRVAIVQANVLTHDNMSLAEQAAHLGAYGRLTREAAKKEPDLVIWPASSLPAPLNSSMLVRLLVGRLVKETGCHFLVGGAGGEKLKLREPGYLPFSNSEFLLSPSGRIEGRYDKIRLLPFNEYLPLQGRIRWPRWITTLEDSFVPGERYTLFRVAGASFGTPICWENLFPDHYRRFVREGARFMVSVTNEGFFGPTPGPHQTLAMNVFRAVENRVAIVRSATTGVSAFIEPDGKIAARVSDERSRDLFVAGTLTRDVPLASARTFYTERGDLFAQTSSAAAVVVTLVFLFWRRRSRATSGS